MERRYFVYILASGRSGTLYIGVTNDLARLPIGEGQYTIMLNENGGVIDDLIVYAPTDAGEALPEGEPAAAGLWRVIVNCGTHDKDLAWMHAQAGDHDVSLRERRDLAMLAIQGPKARARVAELVTQARAALIHELKACGHRLVYLSNMPHGLARWIEDDHPFADWFEDGIFSARVALMKHPMKAEAAFFGLGDGSWTKEKSSAGSGCFVASFDDAMVACG